MEGNYRGRGKRAYILLGLKGFGDYLRAQIRIKVALLKVYIDKD